MKIAIVGATGLVGTKIIEVLEERGLAVSELIPVASEKSVGKKIRFQNKEWSVVNFQTAIDQKPDCAIFSAGGGTSLELAPKFAEAGIRVVDNSSAWRMNPNHKLIVPEINGSELTDKDFIIANPNCSTIQMVMVLKPLHDQYKIKRVVVSTYQSVTGSGIKAVQQLQNERSATEGEKCYPHTIDMNLIPQIDVFMDNDYTKEEMKMIEETNKILSDDTIHVTATAVRIPVMGGHSESLNIEFENDFSVQEVTKILSDFPGVTVQDKPADLEYPMPLHAHNKDDVFVGRIRRDYSQPNALNCWVVADNLRKGAATNAVQIVEHLAQNNLI
jgi:aspartate-semialdehyde dehydrogenase